VLEKIGIWARRDILNPALRTSAGLDWTHKYPTIAKAVTALDARQAYLDGESRGVGPDNLSAGLSGHASSGW